MIFFYGLQHVPKVIAFDFLPLDLVKSNISVLHSLSSEEWQNFNWNSIILFIFFSKHQNEVILAISWSVPKELSIDQPILFQIQIDGDFFFVQLCDYLNKTFVKRRFCIESSIWHWFSCNLVKKQKRAKIWVWIQISNCHQFWCNLWNAYFANSNEKGNYGFLAILVWFIQF